MVHLIKFKQNEAYLCQTHVCRGLTPKLGGTPVYFPNIYLAIKHIRIVKQYIYLIYTLFGYVKISLKPALCLKHC